MEQFHISTGMDRNGDVCLYFQVLDTDGEHIRYATPQELDGIAELLANLRPNMFETSEDSEGKTETGEEPATWKPQ
jgi:hypothetical protein